MDGGRGSRRRANRNRRRIRKQNANTNPTIQINPINQNDPENQSDDSSGSSQSALNKRDQKNINSANLGANTTEISDAKNSCNGGAEVPYEMPSTSTVGPGITFNAETTTEEEFNRLMDGLFCEKMARIKSPKDWAGAEDDDEIPDSPPPRPTSPNSSLLQEILDASSFDDIATVVFSGVNSTELILTLIVLIVLLALSIWYSAFYRLQNLLI